MSPMGVLFVDVASVDANRPIRFEGIHFRLWKQKMMVFLAMKKVACAFNFVKPCLPEKPTVNEIRNVET